MIKKILLLAALISISHNTNGQLNQYKYLVVPVKYDAFKNQNQHKTSTITKFCLMQQGFTAVYDDNLPADLAQDNCIGLDIDLLDESTMFTTKVILVLKDCKGIEVYRTKEGRSKEKDYEKSYKDAITNAVSSMSALNYLYEEKESAKPAVEPVPLSEPVTLSMGDDVKQINETPKDLVVEEKTTTEEQVFKSEPVKEPIPETTEITDPIIASNETVQTLYAQAIADGYQLVDTTPKVVYKLTATSMDDTYLVEGFDGGNGLLYKKEGNWILEYNSKNGKTIRELAIKF